MATTSDRLREIMNIRNMKQVDIIERTGINKGALSSYLSGRYVPKQDNIYKLARVLNVNPAWLMGLDVPMDMPIDKELYRSIYDNYSPEFVEKAIDFYSRIQNLPQESQTALLAFLDNLQTASKNPRST